MANLGKVPPEADAVRDWCCKALTELVRCADAENTKVRPRAAGLQVAHVFDASTAKYKFSPLVYVVPGRGQGKARQKAQHILINYCPFCGRKLDSE